MKRLALLASLAALLAGSAQVRADERGARRLTLSGAVDAAISDNPELAIAARSIDVAGSRVDAAKALRLPRLSMDANVMVWDGPIEINVAPPGVPAELAPTIVAREQVTGSVSLTLAQPLSGLLVTGKLIDLEKTGVDVARSELDGAKHDVAAHTAEVYLRVMQARAGVEIAERSVTQLESQLTRAQALEAGGVLGKVDLMRLESARALAEQAALGARDRLAQAEDALALLLGLPGDAVLETVDDLPAELPAPPWDERQALELAAQKRPQLRTADLRARQADGGVDLQRANLYPNVTALAKFEHTEGMGAFAEEDSFFAGVTLNWALWDWGNRRANINEARGRASQARMSALRQRDQIALDVRAKLRAAGTSHKQLAVAGKGLATAEEAYRILSVRFAGGDATTIDVLDSETEVARARLAAATYRYEHAIALVQLAHAVGEHPLAALGASMKHVPATTGETR